ncbi:MAG: DNA polymerase III subunit alpha [Kiritimatiellae bacterium]|nr:DNA polymerase III subunit alpha [Kiritimatiellia bacterium]
MSDFVHLHLHTTYSLLDGQCQIKPLVAKAKAMGMSALAVTDHGNLFALKAFYDECRENGIKPILGVETYVTSTGDHTLRHEYFQQHKEVKEKRFHLCLHAKNLTGYHNLVKLISEAHINGYYYNPRIDHALLEKYHEGLHCSSACIAGEVAYYLDDGLKGGNDPAKAEEIARWYHGLFGDDYSLEVMIHPSGKGEGAGTVPGREPIPPEAIADFRDLEARQRRVADRVRALGKKLGIRVIATNDVHFLEKDDDDSHDVLLALSTGKKMSDSGRMIYTGQEYFKSEEEMLALFPDAPELVAATKEVADGIEEYSLNSDPIMPKFPIPAEFGDEESFKAKYDEKTLAGMYPEGRIAKFGGYEKAIRIQFEAEYLASLAWDGAKRRWGDPLPPETSERVQFELDTIRTMGFPGYFLIVQDYIAAARRMGVWVGPGRGSAAGSAVAYALGITNVDPLKFDLLFERFLNPDRISMPDIDVDFDDSGRQKVLDFVTNKYGQDHVAHIVTFAQLAAKSVIKDVGRVMDYPLADTNKLVALVPGTPKITFKKATSPRDKNDNPNVDYSQELVDAFNSDDPTVHLLMERARHLEGGMRQPGVHACGVIISRDPLIETLPVMPTENETLLTTQYDGHYVEPVGLLKMDFLGLKTLTVEKECVALLGANNPRVPEELRGADGMLDPDKIPDDDRETYELFGRGETTGLFQFESDGMKKWLMALQPERLTDLVAMNALYRPGPMDYIPAFVRRKKGEEAIVYDHPLMEKYLADTYGVCVYQEQVMLLSRLLGGFTRGDSDKLRKAMGKKQAAVMEALKVKFVEGCLANPAFRIDKWADETEARTLIDKIWDDWRAFASYAFNKSHAVCYAWIAYQTGYLKAHYPAEFMCAQISSEIGNFDKLPGFVAESQEMGLELRLPDVNESGSKFVPTSDAKGIRYGLSGIKGVGAAGEAIVEERKANGPYKGFLDFCIRLAGTPACNKRVLENLTRTGAFGSLEPNRAKLFNNIEYALKKAQQRAKEKASAQASFFDLMDGGEERVSDSELSPSPPFSPAEDLKNERDFLGVYISGHPLQSCRRVIAEVATFKASQMGDEEAVDELLKAQPTDKWKKKSNPHVKDHRALSHLDVRLVGILTACTVKTPKPRPDGTVGQRWAILQIDDGALLDAFCFAKAWESCSALETAVDKLVLLCGEVSHRINYEKDDRFEKRRPSVGDLNFTVREAYVLEDAMPMLSKGMRIRLRYDDPDVRAKAERIRDAIRRSPGRLPVVLEMACPGGKVVDIDLGSGLGVAVTVSFLSELGKIVPQSDVSFGPSDKVYLAPREPKPWEQ